MLCDYKILQFILIYRILVSLGENSFGVALTSFISMSPESNQEEETLPQFLLDTPLAAANVENVLILLYTLCL